MLKIFIPIILMMCLGSCGIETGETLKIIIYGTNVEPSEVDGDTTPFSINLTLESISFTASSTGDVEAFSGPSEDLTVVSREQRILDYDSSELEGETITNLTITLASAFTVNYLEGEASGTLTSPTLTFTEAFDIETGKSVAINCKVNWKNIVGGEALIEPTFTVEKE